MQLSEQDYERVINDLSEHAFVYRAQYKDKYFFVYHTHLSLGGKKITIVLPLELESEPLVFEGHVTEDEFAQKLENLRS